MPEISPGKVLKLSARAAKLYLMCLSVTVGFRVSQHTHRPHPASLLVRVPAVVLLLRASFRLTSRFLPCVSLRSSLLLPVISFQITSFSPCWAHWERPPGRELSCAVRGRVAAPTMVSTRVLTDSDLSLQ